MMIDDNGLLSFHYSSRFFSACDCLSQSPRCACVSYMSSISCFPSPELQNWTDFDIPVIVVLFTSSSSSLVNLLQEAINSHLEAINSKKLISSCTSYLEKLSFISPSHIPKRELQPYPSYLIIDRNFSHDRPQKFSHFVTLLFVIDIFDLKLYSLKLYHLIAYQRLLILKDNRIEDLVERINENEREEEHDTLFETNIFCMLACWFNRSVEKKRKVNLEFIEAKDRVE